MPDDNLPSDAEVFESRLQWFVGHAESLALSPEACCADQGNYNVAHELWYFLRREEVPTEESSLTAAQLDAVEVLCSEVEQVPPEARSWTTVAAESVQNMSHPAWEAPRTSARRLLKLLALADRRCDAP